MEYIEFKTSQQNFAIRTHIDTLGQKILKILDIPIPKVITPYKEFREKLNI